MKNGFQLNEVYITIHCDGQKFEMTGITDATEALKVFEKENSELFNKHPYKAFTETGVHLFDNEADRDGRDSLFKNLTQTHARNLTELVMNDFWTMVENTPDNFRDFPLEGEVDFFLTHLFPNKEFFFYHPKGVVVIANDKGNILYARSVDGELSTQQVEELLEEHPEHVYLSLVNNTYGVEEVVDLVIHEKVSQEKYMDSIEL